MDAPLAQWMSKRAHGGVPVVLRRGLDTGYDAEPESSALAAKTAGG